jgi:hypothetical protein
MFIPTDILGDLIIMAWGIPFYILILGMGLTPFLIKGLLTIHFKLKKNFQEQGFYLLQHEVSM